MKDEKKSMNDNTVLKKGILIVLIVNLINLVFKFLCSFLMPKYLPVDSYAQFKYFQMLVTYIGILHFGFVDGIYLKLGGKVYAEVSKKQLEQALTALVAMEIITAVAAAIISFIMGDTILLSAALIIVPVQVTTFFKYVYQATGEFSKYGKIINASTISVFLFEMFFLFIGKKQSFYYIGAYSISVSLVCIFLFIDSKLKIRKKFAVPLKIISVCKENIYNGIFVMIGNFATNLLTGMDRWFIKILMENVSFAKYSFAVSIVVLLNVAISPFSVALYSYFCVNNDRESVIRIKNIIYIFSVLIIASAFPVKIILELFIKNYLNASTIMFCLFAAQIFNINIVCIYVNLYKATKRQKIYSVKMGVMLVAGFLLNTILYNVFQNVEAFAAATLITTIIWYFLTIVDFIQYELELKKQVFLFVEMSIFLYFGISFSAISGMVAYLLSTLFLMTIFMRKEVINIIYGLRGMLHSVILHKTD